MKQLRSLLLGLVCVLPAVGLAQWQWIDKDGRKVFSDRSPPSDVPANKILRQPGVKGLPAAAAAPESTADGAVATPKQAPGTLQIAGKDKSLEEKKKQAEAAEAEKVKAERDKMAQAKAENCSRARAAKATLDSGQRMAVTNAKGEREVMDDVARAAEAQRLQGIISADCAT